MSQTLSAGDWCAEVQTKLMAALDAAWALIESSNDPAVVALARAKARACGQIASDARKIAGMVPPPRIAAKPRPLSAAIHEAFDSLDAAPRAEAAGGKDKPPAAQAVAMRAALRKLKRR